MTCRATRTFSTLAVSSAEQLLYGVSPHPRHCGLSMTIGGGLVYPEVNFTLPPMNIDQQTWTEVLAHYEQMASESCGARRRWRLRESCWNSSCFPP